MARKRKSTTIEPQTDISTQTPVAELPTPVEEPPARIQEQPQAANDNRFAANDNRPSFAERVGQKKVNANPDSFGIAGDYLAGVRLFENRRDHYMSLKFDEKPGQAVINRLKEAGYRWNPNNMIWTQAVWPATAMATRIKAERLYQEVRQLIRQEKGIETSPEIPF
jgi:hypothetical protein